jgi:hypothetical protein
VSANAYLIFKIKRRRTFVRLVCVKVIIATANPLRPRACRRIGGLKSRVRFIDPGVPWTPFVNLPAGRTTHRYLEIPRY